MMELQIREMKQEDLEEIYRLNKNALGYEYELQKMKISWEEILSDKNSILYIALDCGKIVGYVHAGRYELLCQAPMASVFTLAVSPDYQQNGIGRALLNAVERWARATNCTGVRILSNEKRDTAHYFYQACGYRKTKTQVNFKKYF